MEKTSLEKVSSAFFEALDKVDIPPEDKIELLINVRCFLCSDLYKENVGILQSNTDRYKLKRALNKELIKGDNQ